MGQSLSSESELPKPDKQSACIINNLSPQFSFVINLVIPAKKRFLRCKRTGYLHRSGSYVYHFDVLNTLFDHLGINKEKIHKLDDSSNYVVLGERRNKELRWVDPKKLAKPREVFK